MVSTLRIAELVLSLIIMVLFVGFAIAKYRKTSGFMSHLLWGVAAYFIIAAITNLVRTLAVGGNVALMESISKNQPVVWILILSVSTTVGVIFAVIFLHRMQKDKPNFSSENTPVVNGLFANVFAMVNPLNSSLLVIINYLMFSFALNRGEDLTKLGNGITAENVASIKDILVDGQALMFLYITVSEIVLAVVYALVFKMIFAAIQDNNKKRWALVSGSIFVFVLVTNILASLDGIHYGLRMIGLLAVLVAFVFGYRELNKKEIV